MLLHVDENSQRSRALKGEKGVSVQQRNRFL